jgi:hypothetical protein
MTMDWYEELLQAPVPPAAPRADRPDVTASEVAEFTFCGRAWWLRRETGLPVEAAETLDDGARRHALAGQASEQSAHRVVFRALVGAALIAGIVVALFITGGGR